MKNLINTRHIISINHGTGRDDRMGLCIRKRKPDGSLVVLADVALTAKKAAWLAAFLQNWANDRRTVARIRRHTHLYAAPRTKESGEFWRKR